MNGGTNSWNIEDSLEITLPFAVFSQSHLFCQNASLSWKINLREGQHCSHFSVAVQLI